MPKNTNRRPNIILIVSDDLGYEVIGANGGTSYRTPVLDRMAKNGMRFVNAHVQPLCTPTRVQLMTGKYNFRNYIGFGLMKPDEVTFGHLMSEAGYQTCLSGKWQLYSYNPPNESPEMRSKGQRVEDAGFDEYCTWHAHHTEEKGSRYKDPVIYQNGEYLTDTRGKYGEDIFCDYILDFIDRKKDDEFFVYFPMALTHGPFEPTPDSPEFGDFEPMANKTLGAGTWAEMQEASGSTDARFYKDMVEYHDKVIGRIVDKLKELSLSEDTLIVYLGDNGSPREVCSLLHDHEICGGKGLTNDRGTHVPLICQWPGTMPAGSTNEDLIDSSDFLPTFLEIAGTQPPAGFVMDGKSFLPQLKGEIGKPRDWMFFHFEPMSARVSTKARFIRDQRWKLYDDGRLFDLKADPDEKTAIDPARDNAVQASARARLQPVFQEMVPEKPPRT